MNSLIPPPILKKKKKIAWLVIIPLLIVCGWCFFPFIFIVGTMKTPKITENDYLHNVEETQVTLAELDFSGSIIAEKKNTLTLFTSAERSEFYSSPWRIMDLAGPNKRGRLVVLEIEQLTDKFRFVLIDFKSGSTKIVHEGKGDVISDSVVGQMRMHPFEDKVVYFSGSGHRQYVDAYMNIGKLIELNLSTQSKAEIADNVVETPFDFSASGEDLFFARSTKDAEPQIFQRTINSGAEKSLGTGWSCSVLFDSKTLLIRDRDGNSARSLDLQLGKWGNPVADNFYFWPRTQLTNSLYLATSLPLTKETAEYFPPTGSISGAHLKMRMGVFEPKKRRAAILRNDLDRWEPITHCEMRLSSKAFQSR